jgi:Anti-sigma factor NepR
MRGDDESPERPAQWRSEKALGKALRDRYQEVLNEPVPEKLKQLIEALKKKERDEQD